MKNPVLFIYCFLTALSGFSQDTFTYKTVKASNVTETVVELEGAPQEAQGFTSKSINLSATGKGGGTVNGGTMGNLSVSPTGAVTYTIPIDVPPGLNGIKPDIALYYDSQSGSGLAGWGWNISGISVITRIPATQFHDNLIDPVDFDMEDRFSFDGQRLILKTGTYGADGAVYQTESYSNIKITSHGTHPMPGVSGPQYFKVFYPDGSIAHYSSTSYMDYAITSWENPQGVVISYEYEGANPLRIQNIKYGSRGAATPINEIEFDYGFRRRKETSYFNGTRFTSNRILNEIRVYGNARTPYRNYLITHDETSLDYQTVTSIQEKTGDNSESRSAISFTYGDTPSTITNINHIPLTVQDIEQRNAKVIPLDFTGNGRMDFIVYPTLGPDFKKKFWLFDDIQNLNNPNLYTEVDTGRFVEIFPVNWLDDQNRLSSSQGLVVVQNSGTEQVTFDIRAKPTVAAGAIAQIYTKTWNAPTYKPQDYFLYRDATINRVPLKYLSGDFNGDGLSDVLALERTYTASECMEYPSSGDPNCEHKVTRNGVEYCCYNCGTATYTTTKAHLIHLDRRRPTSFAIPAGFLGRELLFSDKLITMDVNGDGKTDILQFREDKVYVYSLNENNFLELLWETPSPRIKMEFPILPGDYNGDGKADFMIPNAADSRNFSVFLSEGNSFRSPRFSYPFEYKETDFNYQGTTLNGYNLVPVDINGDGKTDIIDYRTTTYTNNDNGTQTVSIYHNSRPTGPSGSDIRFSSGGSRSRSGYLKHFPIPIFLTSDKPNHNLEFASVSDSHVTSFAFSKDHREDITLNQIVNNGVTTTITYDRVFDYVNAGTGGAASTTYINGSPHIFPFVNVDVAPSFKVVRELEQTGAGFTRKQEFNYKGAISHANGLGFLGFEEMKQSNWHGTNVPALWTISKYDPLLRGSLTEHIVAISNNSDTADYMTKVNYFYDYKLIANPGSPIAPQYPPTLNRSSVIPGQQTDQAEQSITLSNGFHAIGSNGTYWAYIFPPEEQPGDVGYAGAVDIRLDRMETDNGLTGVFTTETYTYDVYNNPLTTTTTYPGGSKRVTYQYYNNESATNNTYHIGRIKKMVETVSLNGNSFSSEEQYTYNNNLITQIRKKGNGTGWLTENFTHDANGNILTKTLSGNGVASRSEGYEYSSTFGGRFLTKHTDIEGLETTYDYDAVTGSLLATVNPYNLTTSYEYDKWNRIKKETDYLLNAIDHTYTILGSGGLRHNVDYASGAGEQTTYNTFGWVTRTGTLSLNNQWVYTDFEYYLDGKPRRESEPHHNSPSQWNTTVYDIYGRPVSETLHTGRNISYTYPQASLTSSVNDGVKTITTTLDALGNIIKVEDPGGNVDYTYFANGVRKTAEYNGHVVSIGIDGWGRKVNLNDPSAGSYNYSYNEYGELLTETTPKGTTTYIYDDFGKVTSKTMTGDLTDYVLTYVYDNTTKLIKTINGLDNTNSARAYTYQYTYDTYQRIKKITENTGLANFEYEITYDPQYGRVWKETLVAALAGGSTKTVTTRNEYDASGILNEIWNDGTPDKLWELSDINARGQALTINLGNGMVKNKRFDAYGYLEEIEDKEGGVNPNPTVALHTEYDFNIQRGTLNNRDNHAFNWQETFGYDNLDRLTSISGNIAHTMEYNANGTIKKNSALGDYTYGDNSKKYRLTGIDPNTTGETYFQQHPTQNISYNAFKKPVDIHQAGHGRVSFEYGPLMNRSTAYYGGEDEDRALRRYRKHYSAIIPVEIVEDTQANTTKIVTYVGGDAYSAPIAHIKRTGTGALDEYHYLHRDYLGSILALTDADGDVIEQRHFGAWGSVDKFIDSNSGTTFGHGSLLGRGYTGHEHFFEVSLIHMNGRMYDPQLGRFLSPDNFVQDPFNTQNYNRYGYVLNNPLMYVDPSGEFVFETGALLFTLAKIIFAASAVVGAYAIITNYSGGSDSSVPNHNIVPVPGNNGNNSQIASSMSHPRSRGDGSLDFRLPDAFEYSVPLPNGRFNRGTFGNDAPYGVSQTGSAPAGHGFGITADDVVDTALDFVPIAGGVKDIYKGIRDGDGWQVAMGAGFVVLDVFTLGSASLVKGAVKTGVKAGSRVLARNAARGSSQAFKAFTKSNYRHNLQVLTGKSGVGMDAHHIFPQAKKFQSYFQRAGINIHDPKNLTWWKSGPHRSAANAYNNTWSEFFRATPNATRQQIESFGSSLMKSYGF